MIVFTFLDIMIFLIYFLFVISFFSCILSVFLGCALSFLIKFQFLIYIYKRSSMYVYYALLVFGQHYAFLMFICTLNLHLIGSVSLLSEYWNLVDIMLGKKLCFLKGQGLMFRCQIKPCLTWSVSGYANS
jgi:hypothetical protein